MATSICAMEFSLVARCFHKIKNSVNQGVGRVGVERNFLNNRGIGHKNNLENYACYVSNESNNPLNDRTKPFMLKSHGWMKQL
jgi:hypothetical protein